jgi:hypothetical protein
LRILFVTFNFKGLEEFEFRSKLRKPLSGFFRSTSSRKRWSAKDIYSLTL